MEMFQYVLRHSRCPNGRENFVSNGGAAPTFLPGFEDMKHTNFQHHYLSATALLI